MQIVESMGRGISLRCRLGKHNKKAMMGIGTLIIFIAMVLVAAIAASVLIRTSGVLQERAFAVGNAARQQLVTKVELISVEGLVNTSKQSGFETVYGFEMRVKLSPGSYPIQLKSLNFEFVSSDANLGASAALSAFDLVKLDLGTMINNTQISLGDVNNDDFVDYVSLQIVAGADYLFFNYSDGTNATVYLSSSSGALYDLATVPQTVWVKNLPIPYGDTLIGFANIQGTQTTANVLNVSEVSPTINETSSVCDLDHVIPETKYCFPIVLHVLDEDTIIESGEVFLFKYRLLPEHELTFEEEFEISFIPKAGAEERRRIMVPDVLNRPRVSLWPN